MKPKFSKPKKESIIYEDEKVYACLASQPFSRGQVLVVWKAKAPDLHLLSDRDYDYLMDTVNAVRDAMLKALKVEKVYLLYMDETKQVHWHLVPRYKEKGFDVFEEGRHKIKDFSLARKIKKHLKFD